jgi:hypothetical protein
MTYRPTMPHIVKMEVCERQKWLCACGCGAWLLFGKTRHDHRPALMNRPFNEATKTYTPDANDPKFIDALTDRCHDVRTFGKGGEKRITTRDSDIGEKARETSIAGNFAAFQAFMAKKEPGQPRPKKNTFGRRPMPAKASPP